MAISAPVRQTISSKLAQLAKSIEASEEGNFLYKTFGFYEGVLDS